MDQKIPKQHLPFPSGEIALLGSLRRGKTIFGALFQKLLPGRKLIFLAFS